MDVNTVNFFPYISRFYQRYEYTKTAEFTVAPEQDVNTVDVVHSTKINLPPHCLVWTVCTYFPCPHTRRYVSIYCITCIVQVDVRCRVRE